MSDNHDGAVPGHLPPPAFPSAGRRRGTSPPGNEAVEDEGDTGSVPDEAFISPDDALPGQGEISADAIISPDAPVVRTHTPSPPPDFEEVMTRQPGAGLGLGEVVVTGIGSDPHLDLDPYVRKWGDEDLARVIAAVSYLARQLEERGEAGLRTSAGMSRFEATLRAYCVGYLGGLREKDTNPAT